MRVAASSPWFSNQQSYQDPRQRWLLRDLYLAYYQARCNKRNTINQLEFELNLEANLYELYTQIKNRSYTLSPSMAFVVTKPKVREIFAATFRDRIVHHLIYNYISPYWERQFIADSYSCRPHKGTHYAARRMAGFLRAVTKNYTQEAWVLKLDISSYFMTIDKQIMWQFNQQIFSDARAGLPRAVLELLHYLLPIIIFADPTRQVKIRGKISNWQQLPVYKSLFYTPVSIGFPIGNLTSQLFSNIYLHQLDLFVKKKLRFRFYGRYVDDFVLMHRCRTLLLRARSQIASFLHHRLRLQLHPDKIYLQAARYGLTFVGAQIKPFHFAPGRPLRRHYYYYCHLPFDFHQDCFWHARFVAFIGQLTQYA